MPYCASVREIKVSFGTRQILNNINLDFPARQISLLLGRSGSGKTTLLRCLNRLNECFDGFSGSGSVSVDMGEGLKCVDTQPPSLLRQQVGMVFQTPNPLPLSIRENMLLPIRLVLGLQGEAAEQRMTEQLQQVGLWDEVSTRLGKPADSLSGGQQQRLCLARALVLEPKVLLLDEPTASLDRLSSLMVEEQILLLKERYSIIMVSHSLEQAQRLGDFFAILREGAVAQTLNKEDLAPGKEGLLFLESLL